MPIKTNSVAITTWSGTKYNSHTSMGSPLLSDQETEEQIGSFFQQQAGKATDAKESVTEEFAARACVALVQYIRVGGAVVVEV